MRLFLSDVSPPARPRGSTGLVVGALAVLLLAAAATAGSAPSASAATDSVSRTTASAHISANTAPADAPGLQPSDAASDTPTPTPTPGPPTLDPLPNGLVTNFPLTISGAAQPGEVIDVSGGSSANPEAACTATTDADGRFSCGIQRLPDGPGVPVRAQSRATGLADSGRVDVLSPPVITSADGGTTGGGIRGTAYPGATVTVSAENRGTCSFPADGNGAWGCVIPGLTDGTHTISATQVAPFSSGRSARSRTVTIVVDTVAPAAPSLTSPTPGATVSTGEAITFAGAGETGAGVTVYASTSRGTAVACTATVSLGVWSCSAVLPAGSYTTSALQRDSAGNVSGGSGVVAITVEAVSAAAPTTRAPSPTPAPAPAQPAPPSAAPPSPAGPGHPATKGWTATPFSNASAPVVSVASMPGWLRSVGLAIAAILLLVLPARLLAAALAKPRESERFRAARASLFGRNRARSELGEADALLGGASAGRAATNQPVWLAPVVGVTAAALVTLSSSVQDTAAYFRVLVAVVIAIVAVNAIWMLSARGMTRHLGLPLARPMVRPALLVVVAVTALGSRLIGLEPALLFGLVLGAVLPDGIGRVERGRTAAVQLSAVAAFGVLAWLAVGVLPAPTGEVSAFFVEAANAVALVAIGSTAIALLPFGGLAGRAVLQWSRPLWLALGIVVYTVLFALLLPVASLVQTGAGVVAVVIAALAFAVLSLSVWLWERYVEPAR